MPFPAFFTPHIRTYAGINTLYSVFSFFLISLLNFAHFFKLQYLINIRRHYGYICRYRDIFSHACIRFEAKHRT